jgi:transposase
MKLHGNARLSVKGRELLIDRIEVAGWSLSAAAEAAGISDRTARKWLARHRAEGQAGLLDRSSAPARVANRTDERRVEAIAALRRLRLSGAEIAELLGMALSTVSGILTRIGMGRLGRLGLEPAQRYERQRPGELIHIDVKKLGRIHGGAGKRVRGGVKPLQQPPDRRRRHAQRDRRLGVRAHRHRRRHPPGLRRGPRRREGHHRHRLPAPRARSLRQLRDHRRAVDHR